MPKDQKRFQTGREIMRTYVPDYEPQTVLVDQQSISSANAEMAVQRLVEKFAKRLVGKNLTAK